MSDTVDRIDRVDESRVLDRDTSRGKRLFRGEKQRRVNPGPEEDSVDISDEARERAAGQSPPHILADTEEPRPDSIN